MAWGTTLLKATNSEVVVQLAAQHSETATSYTGVTQTHLASLLTAGDGGRAIRTIDDVFINWIESTGECNITTGRGTERHNCRWNLSLITIGEDNTEISVWSFKGNTGEKSAYGNGLGGKSKRNRLNRKNVLVNKLPTKKDKQIKDASANAYTENFLKITDAVGYSDIQNGAKILISFGVKGR